MWLLATAALLTPALSLIERPTVQNPGLDCWSSCNYSGGACPEFCGELGACCRLGWAEDPEECGGAGGPRFHECTPIHVPDETKEGCDMCLHVAAWPCYDPSIEIEGTAMKPCFSLESDLTCRNGRIDCRNFEYDFSISDGVCGGEDISNVSMDPIPGEGEYLSFAVTDRQSVQTQKVFQRIAPREVEGTPTAMKIELDWVDQGWGNRKGRLYACYKGKTQALTPITASHFRTQAEIIIPDGAVGDFLETVRLGEWDMERSDDVLSISYVVGGGGGHVLYVYDLKISILYEDVDVNMTHGPCAEDMTYQMRGLGQTCTDFCQEKSMACAGATGYNRDNYSGGWCVAGADDLGCDSYERSQICTCEETSAVLPTPRPTQDIGHEEVYTASFPMGSLMGQQGHYAAVSTGKIKITDASTMHINIYGHGSFDKYDAADIRISDFLQVWLLNLKTEEETMIFEAEGSSFMGLWTYHFETPVPNAGVIIKLNSYVSGTDERYGADIRIDHARSWDDDVTDNTRPDLSGEATMPDDDATPWLVPMPETSKNFMEECWSDCWWSSGECDFCGDGACCRLGRNDDEPECGGFGGYNRHACVPKHEPRNDVCTRCMNVAGWPCYDPSYVVWGDNSSPCFSLGVDGRCSEGQMDCRNFVYDFDQFDTNVCEGVEDSSFTVERITPLNNQVNFSIAYDATSMTDWTRLMFGAYFNDGQAPSRIKLIVDWRDQGWGNRKGHINMCLNGKSHRMTPMPAAHYRDTYEVYVGDEMARDWLRSAGGEENTMMFGYVVGGGGGHTIRIEDLTITFEYDTPTDNFLRGVCDEDNTYVALLNGASCNDFCQDMNSGCISASYTTNNWCNVENNSDGLSFDCDTGDFSKLICTCGGEPSGEAQDVVEGLPYTDNKVVNMYWKGGSLMGRWNEEAVTVESAIVSVKPKSVAFIRIEGMGTLDRYRGEDQPYDWLRVDMMSGDGTVTTLFEVDGREWLGTHVHKFEERDDVMFHITVKVTNSDERYNVWIKVDDATSDGDDMGMAFMPAPPAGSSGGSDDGGAPSPGGPSDSDDVPTSGCGFPAKKVKFDGGIETDRQNFGDDGDREANACSCDQLCSRKGDLWVYNIKKGRCTCYTMPKNSKAVAKKAKKNKEKFWSNVDKKLKFK